MWIYKVIYRFIKLQIKDSADTEYIGVKSLVLVFYIVIILLC